MLDSVSVVFFFFTLSILIDESSPLNSWIERVPGAFYAGCMILVLFGVSLLEGLTEGILQTNFRTRIVSLIIQSHNLPPSITTIHELDGR